ncbi:Ig-like domain-containing protein [Anaerophilus nitritogenes]|uniref:Ig-like domain-containing protein n=1 Tax=Anaerophilus nitritogenes TaxID=2498136 RepID=UPI00101DED94|nr:Ig-like domain-containing protein [Anaerophilus nitritogenes]
MRKSILKNFSIIMLFTLLFCSFNIVSFAEESTYPFDPFGIRKGFNIPNKFKDEIWINVDPIFNMELDNHLDYNFERDVKLEDIDAMILYKKDGDAVPVTITVIGNKITLQPLSLLEKNTTYYMTALIAGSKYWQGITTGTNIIDSQNVLDVSQYFENKSKVGNIEGTITWQYNNFIGTKPDVGARVALIPTGLNKDNDTKTFTLLMQQIPQGKHGIYTGQVDGWGNYKIQNVPVGEYYMLVFSQQTYGNTKINQYDEELLKEVLNDEAWKNLKLNFNIYKYTLRVVNIQENQTLNESHDFGNTCI